MKTTKTFFLFFAFYCAFFTLSAQVSSTQKKDSLVAKYIQMGVSSFWAEKRASLIINNQSLRISPTRGSSPAAGSIGINRSSAHLNLSPEELVKQIFCKTGSGGQVSNVTFSGTAWDGSSWTDSDRSLLYYSGGGSTPLAMENGLLVSTGPALHAEGPNDVELGLGGGVYVSDNELNSLADGSPLGSGTVLEFDFIPTGPEVSFEYVFASEEYPEFVNSPFEDIVGIFISGPGISGTKNIAVIPNTSIPLAIKNVNNGLTSINTPSSFPGDSPSNPAYHVSNYNNPAGAYMEYDGHTTVFKAKSPVTPNSTYHLKIAISNLWDESFGSGIFLKANSLDINSNSSIASVLYWNRFAVSRFWDDPTNWVDADGNALNQIPTASSDVHIPGNADHFPYLFTTTNAVCKNITFHFGAELAQQHLLTYQKAYIQYNWGQVSPSNVQTNKDLHSDNMMQRDYWYALSIPLKKVVAGDFCVGGYPFTWFSKFRYDPIGNSGHWDIPKATYNVEFSTAMNYSAGIWVPVHQNLLGENDHTNLNALNGIFEFPYFENPEINPHHRIHSWAGGVSSFQYFNSSQPGFPLLSAFDTYNRGDEAYRFITDGNLIDYNGSKCFKMTVPAGEMVMVANPFISSFDFGVFRGINLSTIENYYYMYERVTWNTYSSGFIPSFQSFFVRTKGTGIVDLYFPVSASDTRNSAAYQLKSSRQSGPENVVFIETQQGAEKSKATLSFNVNYSESSIPAIHTTDNPSFPQLYLKDETGGRNSLLFKPQPESGLTILGVRSKSTGAVTLEFSNLENLSYDSFILTDRKTGRRTDILSNPVYTFQNDSIVEARFELSVRQTGVTSIGNTWDNSNGLTVRLTDNELQVSSTDKEIRTVSVFTIYGTSVLADRVSGLRYNKSIAAPRGTYLVSVVMEDGETVNRKVILK